MSYTLSVVGTQDCRQPVSAPSSLADSVRHSARRVQLIFPPMVYPKFQSKQTALFPLGLGYIGAVLEREGLEISFVDCASEGFGTHLDIGKDREVYGLTPDQVRARIEEFRPEAIGLSCLFSSLEKRMWMIARAAKQVDPNILVFCGGPHASAFPTRVLSDPAVDYCVVGEGEETAVDLFRALNNGGRLEDLGGVYYRKDGAIVGQPRGRYIENLDVLPLPARHMVDMEMYFRISEPQSVRLDGDQRHRLVPMTTSRGCPFQCSYCGKNVTWGKGYRTHSAKYVLDEMEHVITKYGADRFAFQDDNFTADMERAAQIFDGMVERRFNITWEAPNGLGVNFLSPPLLEKMKASGCHSFTVAVESANDATLRRVKKPNYIKLAPPIVKKAKELDIEVRGFFMIGFPGESLEEINKTVSYARALDLAVANFNIVAPLPGTTLYKECVDAGIIDETRLDFEDFAFGAFDIELSKVPVAQLRAIRKVEWMRTMFLDQDNRFRGDCGLKRGDILDELTKGAELLPDNQDVAFMRQRADAYYAEQDRSDQQLQVA